MALSLSLRTAGVTCHRALRSPDFPPTPAVGQGPYRRERPSGRPEITHYHTGESHTWSVVPARMPTQSRIHSLDFQEPFPAVLRGGAVSIGNFDGVHLGHAALMQRLKQQARQIGGPAVAVTFDPHPLALLTPDRFLPQLNTPMDRAELLLQAGADWVVILQTTRDLLQLPAEGFLAALLQERLDARHVVEGFNFGYGRDRQGNTSSLERWCKQHGLQCEIVAALTAANEQPISSSRVRMALTASDVASAARLLGRPYRLRGKVVVGDRRGATLGFPTANLDQIATVIPGDGVYAVRAVGEFGTFAGAANIGPNPTFGVARRKVEVHLLDFDRDLYNSTLAIDFVARLRDTRTFDSKEELVRQLREDVEIARRTVVQ